MLPIGHTRRFQRHGFWHEENSSFPSLSSVQFFLPNACDMKLVLVHYHLNPGGVTRVMENHLRALAVRNSTKERLPVLVLHGGRCDGWPADLPSQLPTLNLKLRPIAGLDYDDLSAPEQPLLTRTLRNCLQKEGFEPQDTLIHVHNHNLGKNATFPRTLHELAKEGYRVLLQIHDFAEDFRPANYRELTKTFSAEDRNRFLYPQSEHIHYAVLNRRDDKILEAAGVPATRRHFLPNPVAEIGKLPDRTAARNHLAQTVGLPADLPFFLYPVRGIRRKNVGEMLLWSALHAGMSVFGITLAPQNPRELRWYELWRTRARDLELPCWWDLGSASGLGFLDHLAASDAILTTSVAEGFGMVFLEAWLANRPLYGRNLPSITADFVEEGISLPTLYDHIQIPTGWIEQDQYRTALQESLNPLLISYGLPAHTRDDLTDLIESKYQSGGLDFGELNEEMQMQMIQRVHSNPTDREELLERNPALKLSLADHSHLIAQNQTIIRETYSLAGSGDRLDAIYQQLLASPVSEIAPLPSSETILNAFLDPQKFRLIRS